MTSVARNFVDSNIWIYALSNQDDERREKARKLVKTAKNEICFTAQIVGETCFNLKRKSRYSEKEIRRLILSFFLHHRFIDTSESIMTAASELREKYPLSFWDGLVVAAAISAECETLFSEDMQNGLVVNGQLKIVNPFKD